MSVLINCPSCQRPLQVPEELVGKMVKCPACGLTFAAPAPAPQTPVPAAPQTDLPEPAMAAPGSPFGEPGLANVQRGRGLIIAPAIFLLLVGLLGIASNGYFYVSLAGVTPEQKEQMKEQTIKQAEQKRNAPLSPQEKEQFQGLLDFAMGAAPAFGVFAVLSLLVLLGGICMLMSKAYWLAVIGSVLAMVDLGCGCCILGLPAGIWSLIVLLNPDVKATFR